MYIYTYTPWEGCGSVCFCVVCVLFVLTQHSNYFVCFLYSNYYVCVLYSCMFVALFLFSYYGFCILIVFLYAFCFLVCFLYSYYVEGRGWIGPSSAAAGMRLRGGRVLLAEMLLPRIARQGSACLIRIRE